MASSLSQASGRGRSRPDSWQNTGFHTDTNSQRTIDYTATTCYDIPVAYRVNAGDPDSIGKVVYRMGD